ncbi:MAG: hypothetical protein LBF22_12425, partial [Deltaproteobacteria bacterium]|nr:hypothetical protein [Deltaproteobacteria bacterium]
MENMLRSPLAGFCKKLLIIWHFQKISCKFSGFNFGGRHLGQFFFLRNQIFGEFLMDTWQTPSLKQLMRSLKTLLNRIISQTQSLTHLKEPERIARVKAKISINLLNARDFYEKLAASCDKSDPNFIKLASLLASMYAKAGQVTESQKLLDKFL